MDAFSIEDNVPDPVLTGDRVLIRIRAFWPNRMAIVQREAKYPYT